MRLIRILLFILLCWHSNRLYGQDYIYDGLKQDLVYRSLIDRPNISLVYSQQGIVFSDWLINNDGLKVFAVYRLNKQAFSDYTPLLLLDNNNTRLDSIVIRNWPQDGIPWAFPILTKLDGKIAYQPLSIYPDEEKFPELKKGTKGFVKIETRELKLGGFELVPVAARLNKEFFEFNEKKQEFSIPALKVKIPTSISLVRFKDANTLVIDKENRRYYFFNPDNPQILSHGTIPLTVKDRIINVEMIGDNIFLLVYRNGQDGFYYVSSFDMSSLKISDIYFSKYLIPRAKSLNKDIYFELSGKFGNATNPESILLKLSNGLK